MNFKYSPLIFCIFTYSAVRITDILNKYENFAKTPNICPKRFAFSG